MYPELRDFAHRQYWKCKALRQVAVHGIQIMTCGVPIGKFSNVPMRQLSTHRPTVISILCQLLLYGPSGFKRAFADPEANTSKVPRRQT